MHVVERLSPSRHAMNFNSVLKCYNNGITFMCLSFESLLHSELWLYPRNPTITKPPGYMPGYMSTYLVEVMYENNCFIASQRATSLAS